MRDSLVVGILRETKAFERRTPLVPADVRWLKKRGVFVEVQSSADRVYDDGDYQKAGAIIVDRFKDASLIIGVKEPPVRELQSQKIYMVFSHTAKGQLQNMPLLRACLRKKITLIDYERIVDFSGERLVYFGRFAGICGMVDSLHYLGRKLLWMDVSNPFASLRPAHDYSSLKEIKTAIRSVDREIRRKGLKDELLPFIIGITGHGNVSRGAQEVLDLLKPRSIHPGDMRDFVRQGKKKPDGIYKIVFLREEKFRSRDGKGFYFEEYLSHPARFESNLDTYLPFINMLIHTAYWDSRYPRLVTKRMIDRLHGTDPFRLAFIGDLSCDVRGSIEITHKTTQPGKATFTYNPTTEKFVDGYRSKGVTVLAVDNLPAELPGDASEEFSGLIRDYVYQIAVHGVKDITSHMALPVELRRAVVTQDGKLTKLSNYLKKYL